MAIKSPPISLSSTDVDNLINSHTGWGLYIDTSLSSGSPQVITEGNSDVITNNGGAVNESQLPIGATAFYNSTTSKITPNNIGDCYVIRVDFTAFTTSQSGRAILEFDIGGAEGIILRRSFNFPKGAGITNAINFSASSLLYSLTTFVGNGASIKLNSEVGDTSIYDVRFLVTMAHKAR